MVEDLTGNIRRVYEGIADEIAKRVVADTPGCEHAAIRNHVLQVLLDWFMGEFIPRQKS